MDYRLGHMHNQSGNLLFVGKEIELETDWVHKYAPLTVYKDKDKDTDTDTAMATAFIESSL